MLTSDRNCGGGGCFDGEKARKKFQQDSMDDSMLARELNELTVKERERVLEEVHGVAEITKETPELVQESLAQLREELLKMPRTRRRAYDKALFLKPSLAKDTKFNLMFLRSDRYDAAHAARKMCSYFTNKLELFGEEKIIKQITLDDLNEDDMAAVNTGSVHILPQKDSAGRAIWFIAQRHYKYKYWQNQVRYLWYQLMVALQDEDIQLNGLVNVIYLVDMATAEHNFFEMASRGGPMIANLPFRVTGVHCCFNDLRLRPALTLYQMIVGKQARLRFRAHYGSNLEAQYALMTFGIPMKLFPIRSDGSLKDRINESYLAERRLEERQEENKEQEQMMLIPEDRSSGSGSSIMIRIPTPTDVLLGRGRPFQEYGGNKILASIIHRLRDRYQQADRFEKTCISMDVVKTISQAGGRFLQRVPEEGWEEVKDNVARDKVSHGFRTKAAKQQQQQAALQTPLEMPAFDPATSSKRIRYNDQSLMNEHHFEPYDYNFG